MTSKFFVPKGHFDLGLRSVYMGYLDPHIYS